MLPNLGRSLEAPGRAWRKVACGFLDLLFPDECRICECPLRELSRIPVCAACLRQPAPLQTEDFCRACGNPFLDAPGARADADEDAKGGLCTLCRSGFNSFDHVYAAGAYEGALRKLIHLFKFEGIRPLAGPLGAFLTGALPRERMFDAIVPMPLHWRRRWQRGFNQSELLAREIARRWRMPVRRLVRRKRATAPQAGLTSAQRRTNVQGAFEAIPGARLDGLRILLIDDVLTTGATADACARALKRAGAAGVSLLTLARRDRHEGLTELEMATAAAASKVEP